MPFRPDPPAPPLVGRAPQARRLDELTARLHAGHGGALVLVGEPGAGKTALLTRLLARLRDVTVLAATGFEAESALPFATLGDLLRPLLPGLGELPEPQARALGTALALTGAAGPVEPYAVCLATLTLLTAAAERQPVLVVVDDAGWIDRPSRDALLFTARRVEHDAAGLVLAVRDPVPPEFVAAGADPVRLDGLTPAATGDLLDRLRPGRVAAGVRADLWTATGGNPGALTELGHALGDDQLGGAAALPDPLPIGAGLRDAFAERLAPLPPATRTALLTAALAASDDAGTVTAALDDLGAGPAALAGAVSCGLLVQRGGQARLAHPLLRAAVRHAAAPAERRRVYDALAGAATGAARAWYRAAELAGADEAAAAELVAAAGTLRRHAGFAGAARALHRAAELAGDRETYVRRMLAAAADAQMCGQLPEASSWLGEALPAALEPALHAEVALAYGWVLNRCGTPGRAREILVAAAQRLGDTDPHRAAGLWCAAVNPALTSGRVRDAAGYAGRAVTMLDRDGARAEGAPARTVLAQALAVRGRIAGAGRLLDEDRAYLEALDPLRDGELLAMTGLTRLWLGRTAEAQATLLRVVRAARRAGALGPLSRALLFSAMARYDTGDWAVGLAEAAHLTEAAPLAGPGAVHGLTLFRGAAAGLRHLAAGAPAEAITCLEPVRDFVAHSGADNPAACGWESDLVEAYRTAGRLPQAHRQLDALAERARIGDLPAPRADVALHRALLADDPVRFERAPAHPHPFDQARMLLAYGEMPGRRDDAVPHLRRALSIFRRLGAEPFVRRTAALLAGAGPRRGPDPVSLLARLTPRELQVACAVADGLSNPEAAQALFLSRKTVETHLSSAYRKLGVRSRTQLVRYLAEAGVSGSSPTADRLALPAERPPVGDLPEAGPPGPGQG
ncbi:LuxR family transcriptional regulator [Symbioplanes lichenis]|uniref:AAA family ATPase n=1 Tax=Symbioplanes lichenis TaxID=1629072 RepID=UPI002739409C|nr:LuxR family transcriptional regulator [Actinoplanes lichenis]